MFEPRSCLPQHPRHLTQIFFLVMEHGPGMEILLVLCLFPLLIKFFEI